MTDGISEAARYERKRQEELTEIERLEKRVADLVAEKKRLPHLDHWEADKLRALRAIQIAQAEVEQFKRSNHVYDRDTEVFVNVNNYLSMASNTIQRVRANV